MMTAIRTPSLQPKPKLLKVERTPTPRLNYHIATNQEGRNLPAPASTTRRHRPPLRRRLQPSVARVVVRAPYGSQGSMLMVSTGVSNAMLVKAQGDSSVPPPRSRGRS